MFGTWRFPCGALFVGSPQEIRDELMRESELVGHDEFLTQIGLGGLPLAEGAHSLEPLATEIMPVVRRVSPLPLESTNRQGE